MKPLNLSLCPIFCFMLAGTLLGCAVRLNPITSTKAFPKVLEKARKEKKYLVMHSGVDTFAITDVQVAKAKSQFTVHLAKPDSVHRAALINPTLRSGKYLHVFMRDSTSYTLDEPHTLPLNKIARIELVD